MHRDNANIDEAECTNVSDSSGTSIENKVPNYNQGPRIIIGRTNRSKPERPFISIHEDIKVPNVESMVQKWVSPQFS